MSDDTFLSNFWKLKCSKILNFQNSLAWRRFWGSRRLSGDCRSPKSTPVSGLQLNQPEVTEIRRRRIPSDPGDFEAAVSSISRGRPQNRLWRWAAESAALLRCRLLQKPRPQNLRRVGRLLASPAAASAGGGVSRRRLTSPPLSRRKSRLFRSRDFRSGKLSDTYFGQMAILKIAIWPKCPRHSFNPPPLPIDLKWSKR